MRYACMRCGAHYSAAYVEKWGTTKASDGMGAQPLCTKLVDAPNAPKARHRRPNGTEELQTPQQLCRGSLMAEPRGEVVDDDNDAKAIGED